MNSEDSFKSRFSEMLKTYPEAIPDRKRFVGLLKDIFPQESMYVNLIVVSYDLGIREDIEKSSQIDNVFVTRYVKRMVDEYCINSSNAIWTINLWTEIYAEDILGIKSNVDKNYVYTASGNEDIPKAYKFLGKQYTNIKELVNALGINWDDGKKQVVRGLLSAYFKDKDPEIAGYCIDAEEAIRKDKSKEDYIYFELLYKICPQQEKVYWQGRSFQNMRSFAEKMLEGLWKDKNKTIKYIDSVLDHKIIEIYYKTSDNKKPENYLDIVRHETRYNSTKYNEKEKLKIIYFIVYTISGNFTLCLSDRKFQTVDDVIEYVNELVNESFSNIEDFCRVLVDNNGTLDPQFENWLIMIGKKNEIEIWKKQLK